MRSGTIPSMASMTATEWADRDEDAEGELVDGVVVEEEMAGFGAGAGLSGTRVGPLGTLAGGRRAPGGRVLTPHALVRIIIIM